MFAKLAEVVVGASAAIPAEQWEKTSTKTAINRS
jgi:hypothetical protein